jgi:hypothetical protein
LIKVIVLAEIVNLIEKFTVKVFSAPRPNRPPQNEIGVEKRFFPETPPHYKPLRFSERKRENNSIYKVKFFRSKVKISLDIIFIY